MSSFPSSWGTITLGQLGQWVGGGTPSKSNPAYWLEGTVPWVSPKDMKRDIIADAEDKITSYAVDSAAAQTIPPESLLVVTRSGILQHTLPIAVTSVAVAINQDLKALLPTKGVDPNFIASQLRANANAILSSAVKSGTTVHSLDFERLKSTTVKLPPFEEQLRISKRLGHYSERINRTRTQLQRIPLLIERIRERLADLCAQGMLTSNLRLENRLLDPIQHNLADLTVEPIRNGLSVRGSSSPPGVRALRLSALRSSPVDMTDVRYLPIDNERASKYVVKEGDVLISRGSGTRAFVGLAALVPKFAELTIFPDTAFRIRLDRRLALPEWFVLVWNSSFIRSQLVEMSRTTAGIWKISQGDLAQIRLQIPSLDEQREAVRLVRKAAVRLDRLNSKYFRATRLLSLAHQAFSERAFSGKLVHQDPAEGNGVQLVSLIKASKTFVRRKTVRTRMAVRTTEERVRELFGSWPPQGYAFEQLRKKVPAPYEELKEIIFTLLEKRELEQKFIAKDQKIFLLRRAS